MLRTITHRSLNEYRREGENARPDFSFGESQTLAFCFLTVSGVVFDQVWGRFFATAYELGLKYEIYVYAHPDSDIWQPNLIDDRPQTSWARSVRGQRALWRAAAKGNADKAILLSESCIPTQHPLDVWRNLGFKDKSIIQVVPALHGNNYRVKSVGATNPHNRPLGQYDLFHRQWCVIHRNHFEAVDNEELNTAYDNVPNLTADNETYTLAALLMAGKDGEWIIKQPTHCLWVHNATSPITYVSRYNEMSQPKPRKFYQAILDVKDRTEITVLTNQMRNHLFARKFHPDWDQQALIDMFLSKPPT